MTNSVRAYIFLTFAVLFWSGNVIFARLLHSDISAIALASGRWWLATIFLLPFAWRFLKKDINVILKNLGFLSLISFLGISLFNTLLYQAAHTTTSNNIALIQTTMPAMIILLAVIVLKEKIRPLALFGVAISISGAMMVVARGDLDVLLSWDFARGDMWMFIANMVYAIYSIMLKKRPDIHPVSFLGASFVIGSILLVPLFLWDIINNPLPEMTATLTTGFLYIAIFPSILSYLFWNRGVTLIGASLAGFFICLIPIFTAVLAAFVLTEALSWYHLLGMAFIMVGFVLFQRR